MNEIWANRLIAGTKIWDDVPDFRKEAVMAVLADRVARGIITREKYQEITGESLEA